MDGGLIDACCKKKYKYVTWCGVKNVCILLLELLVTSCFDDDLERKVDSLEYEIEKVISTNDILSLKYELYLACYEGKLLK